MAHWLEHWSIRSRIGLLLLAILLPMAGTLGWLLAMDMQEDQDAARERVRSIARETARDLQHRLGDIERALAHLAARPAARAMGPGACDPVLVEFLLLTPGFNTLSVRDLQGRSVCSQPPAPPGAGADPGAGATSAPRTDGLGLGSVQVQAATGGRTAALSYPIRDGAGQVLGHLVLQLDLLVLNQTIFPPILDSTLVTVVDASQTVALHSFDPGAFIGQQVRLGDPAPPGSAQDGVHRSMGRDGVPQLSAVLTLPHGGWRVAASLPSADVLSDYHRTLWRTLALGGGLALLALVLGWRLSGQILRPVSDLQRAAERVAQGDDTVRSPVRGPAEVRAVALAFNRALDARRLSDSRLRGIFDATLDAIITCDESHRIVEANPAAADMFRCSVEDMTGASLSQFMPVRFRQAHGPAMRRFGDEDATVRRMAGHREVFALRADGEEFPIEASISHVNSGEGRLYTVIHRDITDRRRAELVLRDSEARLRELLTKLPEAVIVSAGDRIDFVNAAACRLLGADAQALCGQSLQAFIPAGSSPRLSAHLAGRVPVVPLTEVTIVRSDGALRQVESLGTPVEYGGGQATLMVMRDISELKRAQAELAASHADLTRLVTELDNIQEAERRRIAREVHDDLQQTLAAIRMDLCAIIGGLDGPCAPARLALTRVDALAEAAIASTRRIINDLRPQVLEDLGLVAALETLAARFELRNGVPCALRISDLSHADDGIDPAAGTCLYRVAQEALNNVAKHALALHVQLHLQQVGADRLRLTISDDGVGLAEADLRKPQSFGLLGMRERVRAAHGSLQVVGAPGGGTRLTVEIPAAPAA
jgi:PAS domain S-box-containing protein